MSFGPITSVQIQGVKLEAVTDFLFLVSRITAVGDCSHEIRRQLLLGKKAMTNLNSVLKSKDITLLKKVLIIKAMVFPVHVWLWDLDCKEGRVPKNWCLQTVLLEKTLESLLDRKEIKPVNLKVNQPWILIGRTDAKGEAPIFWSPNNEQPTHWKDSDAGKDREEGEEGARGWDGWMASPMQWPWTWANSGRRRGTGRPGVLQSTGSQRVRHNWVTEQKQKDCKEKLWFAVMKN